MAAEYISQYDFQDTDSLNKRCLRKVYLVTYSQVGEEKCSDRERFTEMVLEAFDPRKRTLCSLSSGQYQKNLNQNQGFTITCV